MIALLASLGLAAASDLPALPTEVPEKYRCEVEVVRVIGSADYRGAYMTPSSYDYVDSLSGDALSFHIAEDHGESHRKCTYQVSMAGGTWSWVETWSTTIHELPPDWCNRAKDHVAAQIQRITDGCTWPAAGAYWGWELKPEDTAANVFADSANAKAAALQALEAQQASPPDPNAPPPALDPKAAPEDAKTPSPSN